MNDSRVVDALIGNGNGNQVYNTRKVLGCNVRNEEWEQKQKCGEFAKTNTR